MIALESMAVMSAVPKPVDSIASGARASAVEALRDERLISGALRDRVAQVDLEPVDRQAEPLEREYGTERDRICHLGLEIGVAARGRVNRVVDAAGPRIRDLHRAGCRHARQEELAETGRAHVLRQRRAETQPVERIVDRGGLPARERVLARDRRVLPARRLVLRLACREVRVQLLRHRHVELRVRLEHVDVAAAVETVREQVRAVPRLIRNVVRRHGFVGPPLEPRRERDRAGPAFGDRAAEVHAEHVLRVLVVFLERAIHVLERRGARIAVAEDVQRHATGSVRGEASDRAASRGRRYCSDSRDRPRRRRPTARSRALWGRDCS